MTKLLKCNVWQLTTVTLLVRLLHSQPPEHDIYFPASELKIPIRVLLLQNAHGTGRASTMMNASPEVGSSGARFVRQCLTSPAAHTREGTRVWERMGAGLTLPNVTPWARFFIEPPTQVYVHIIISINRNILSFGIVAFFNIRL